MKRFLNHIFVCIYLYMQGYYFSDNAHNNDMKGRNILKPFWGFARLNFKRGNVEKYSILDIDFHMNASHEYTHLHGDNNFRFDVHK